MNSHRTIIAITLTIFIYGCSEKPIETSLIYPETNKTDHEDEYFGHKVPDPYHWLEDDESPETTSWVEQENLVTFGYLENIDFRDAVKGRLEELLDYERVSAPFVEGDYEYFYKNDGLQNHSVLYRTKTGSDNPEIFIDPNSFAEDGTIGLRGVFFTKDGSLSVHMISDGGSDWRMAITMDVETKEVLEDTLVNIKFSGISWQNKEGFYYSSYDVPTDGSELSAKTQHHKLFYHKLGTSQDDDLLIFGGEKQPNRYIGGFVTEDQNYLVVSAAENTSGNQIFIRRINETSDFELIQGDHMARFSPIENQGTDFYFLTNIDAPLYRVVKVDLNNSDPSNWVDVIPEAENVLRAGAGGGKIFANYLVDAQTNIKQFDLTGKLEREVELPGIGSAFGFGEKFDAKELYYTFTSFTYPTTIFKYTISTGESELYMAPEVDFNPEDYTTEQVFYESNDGTKIPMFITYKKGLDKNGKNATYLYGYGGFNISMTPGFSPYRIVWMENGGIYAQANLRGGGEYGEDWHLAGTKMNKQNVFDDFISAGEFLISNNYTSSEYLAIAGGSNGGLLVGATMTQRPDLARVALPAVGVMDMLKYHTFTAGAGWSVDYGTSEDSEEMFKYLLKYSPYHALTPETDYPATMVTTADHDDRVVPAHSFKFSARLQEYNSGDNPVLIRIQTRAGHGSVSTKQRIELAADQYSFIWYNMGIIPDVAKKSM